MWNRLPRDVSCTENINYFNFLGEDFLIMYHFSQTCKMVAMSFICAVTTVNVIFHLCIYFIVEYCC